MTSATSIELRFTRLRAGALVPERQTSLASGYDLHASIEGGSITIGQSPVSVPTGIAVAAPAGADVQIRPRSGLFARGVIGMLGTIDADYRGEIQVILMNAGEADFEIARGDRIAQLVVAPVARPAWAEVETLDTTDRGEGGFGHTGQG